MPKLNKQWFRSFHGTPTDNRFRVVAKKAGSKPAHAVALWWVLNDCASQAHERGCVKGFDAETFADFSEIPESEVNALIAAFTDKGMLVDGAVANWERDQPLYDATANERQQRRRAKTAGANDNTADESAPNIKKDAAEDLPVTPSVTPVTVGHGLSRSVTTDEIREDQTKSEKIKSEKTRSPQRGAESEQKNSNFASVMEGANPPGVGDIRVRTH
jgi:hypothetical protein